MCHLQNLAIDSQGQGHDFVSNWVLCLDHMSHICVLSQTANGMMKLCHAEYLVI